MREEDHYCTHCGSTDLAAGELYASGRAWTCRQCGNVFQRTETNLDTAWGADPHPPQIAFPPPLK